MRWKAIPVIALLLFSTVARANGRFPKAQAIESVPGSDGKTLFLRATFGILVSRDAGRSWQWICERALGYEGAWDPPIAVTRDGRLWIGLERGLVSTVDGCEVTVSHELDGHMITDLTADPEGKTIWAVTGAPDKLGAIWRRSPGAAGWERVGSLPESFHAMTIEVAPSRPSTLYLTGQPWETIRGWLLRSDDGGKTIVPGVGGKNDLVADGPFFLAAVDPVDPQRALLRHTHTAGSDVLMTTDGGRTLKNVLSMKSAMFGFAKSADGRTYWAASSLAEHGISRSTDRGAHWEKMSEHGVLCLHAAPNGWLFGCENTLTLDAKTVSLSTDGGRTMTAIASFADIKGPQKCADPDAGASLCEAQWPETLALLTPRDAGPLLADGGARRRRRDAGAASGGASGAPDEGQTARKSACGCTSVGADARLDHRWLTAGLLPLAVWARARSRPGSSRARRVIRAPGDGS